MSADEVNAALGMDDDERLLKAAHASLSITFGTSAPFSIGPVSAERVGYAHLPSVVLNVICRDEDIPALVPIVRQRVYRELAERGWTPDDIGFRPGTQRGRRRKFVDENESSESHGKNKFGSEYRFRFDMGRELALATFGKYPSGSFARLVEHPSRTGASG